MDYTTSINVAITIGGKKVDSTFSIAKKHDKVYDDVVAVDTNQRTVWSSGGTGYNIVNPSTIEITNKSDAGTLNVIFQDDAGGQLALEIPALQTMQVHGNDLNVQSGGATLDAILMSLSAGSDYAELMICE